MGAAWVGAGSAELVWWVREGSRRRKRCALGGGRWVVGVDGDVGCIILWRGC